MTEGNDAPHAASPCVRRCRLDRPDGVCLGCGRTVEEIAGWTGLDPAERQAVTRRLPDRLARRRAGVET